MSMQVKTGLLLKEFYINYEECKFMGEFRSFRGGYSFILTMRNVNYLKVYHKDYNMDVLY